MSLIVLIGAAIILYRGNVLITIPDSSLTVHKADALSPPPSIVDVVDVNAKEDISPLYPLIITWTGSACYITTASPWAINMIAVWHAPRRGVPLLPVS